MFSVKENYLSDICRDIELDKIEINMYSAVKMYLLLKIVFLFVLFVHTKIFLIVKDILKSKTT